MNYSLAFRLHPGLCVLLLTFSAFANADEPPVPLVQARAGVVIDARTGQAIYALNANKPLPPASTTKVLTTLLALERLDLDNHVVVSANAAATPPSVVGLRAQEMVSVQDLLLAVMLRSGNDAATAAAEAVAGSVKQFSYLMNERAREIGARHSHFTNPHGLPSRNHYASAFDLALIFRSAMENEAFRTIGATQSARLKVVKEGAGDRVLRVRTRNRLLGNFTGMDAGKTGYTRAAGRCFVGQASRDGHRLIAVVLGSRALWPDVRKLFDFGFAKVARASQVEE